ncbi:MAG: cupredoxin domain-containing protein, partial [Candidatus Magasanikbacteria bacterium]|nr:cupredoxin domain-containing protein [Candidatus Magasanikbacteria bacterium]
DTVKIKITSVDVTHGFALRDFNVASTIEAGKTTEVQFVADKTGTFTFFCNVFCGEGHGGMRGTLIVK